MKNLTDEQAVTLDRFISEYWSEFVSHCDGEDFADEIATALGAE